MKRLLGKEPSMKRLRGKEPSMKRLRGKEPSMKRSWGKEPSMKRTRGKEPSFPALLVVKRLLISTFAASALLVGGGVLLANAQPTSVSSSLPAIDFGPGVVDLPVLKHEGVDGRAFGDSAAGCYASIFRISIPDDAGLEIITQSIRDILIDSDINTETIVTKDPMYSGATSMLLKGTDVDGIATLAVSHSGARRATLLSCYWNDRLPKHCQHICETSLQNYYQNP